MGVAYVTLMLELHWWVHAKGTAHVMCHLHLLTCPIDLFF